MPLISRRILPEFRRHIRLARVAKEAQRIVNMPFRGSRRRNPLTHNPPKLGRQPLRQCQALVGKRRNRDLNVPAFVPGVFRMLPLQRDKLLIIFLENPVRLRALASRNTQIVRQLIANHRPIRSHHKPRVAEVRIDNRDGPRSREVKDADRHSRRDRRHYQRLPARARRR